MIQIKIKALLIVHKMITSGLIYFLLPQQKPRDNGYSEQ